MQKLKKVLKKRFQKSFLKHGEPFFRMLESEKLRKFCREKNMIISAGGGAFENEDNRKLMLDNANVIYLKATPEEIYTRIKNETHRPLLKKNFSIEKIANIIEMRKKNYEKANIIIDTNGKTPYDIVKEILGALNG